jgi:hypothetical protein
MRRFVGRGKHTRSVESVSPHRSHRNHRIGIQYGHSDRLTAWFCCPCVVKHSVRINVTRRTPFIRDYMNLTARLGELHTDDSTKVIVMDTY